MNTSTLNGTLVMIDNLKTVCANFGLANDSSEYKIITEAFLYKYLNDRMIYELSKLDQFADCHDVQSVEGQYRILDAEDHGMLLYELGTTAIIRPEWMVSSLYNQKDKDDFAKTFDAALIGIAQDNLDVYSVKAGAESITLFQGVFRIHRGGEQTQRFLFGTNRRAGRLRASPTRSRKGTTSSRRCSNISSRITTRIPAATARDPSAPHAIAEDVHGAHSGSSRRLRREPSTIRLQVRARWCSHWPIRWARAIARCTRRSLAEGQ